jgi:dienelactone hydrolase
MKQLIKIPLALSFIFFKIVSGYAYDTLHIPSDVFLEKYSTELIGYLSKPEGEGPFPTVVLMHGCDGLSSSFAKQNQSDLSRLLNDHGFATVIVDSFSGRWADGGSVCFSEDKLGAARYYRIFDAFNTLIYLRQKTYVDHDNVFLVGHSNGGSVALMVAKGGTGFNFPDDLKYTAIAAYYPWCGMSIGPLVSPLLVLSGAKDDWTPPDGCIYQKDTVKGEDFEVVVYPDAHHGFDGPISQKRFAGHTLAAHPLAAIDSRGKLLNFFKKYFSK